MRIKILTLTILSFLIIMTSCSLVFEDDISNEQIIVIMPIDKTVSDSTKQLFWWEAVPEAMDYTLQLLKGSFALPEQLLYDTTITGQKLSLELNPGLYQWRLRANAQNSFTPYQYYNLEVTANEK